MEKYARSLGTMMAGASLLGVCFTMAGLYLSYRFDLTSGAAIIMVAGTVFLVTLGCEKIWDFRPRTKTVHQHAGELND